VLGTAPLQLVRVLEVLVHGVEGSPAVADGAEDLWPFGRSCLAVGRVAVLDPLVALLAEDAGIEVTTHARSANEALLALRALGLEIKFNYLMPVECYVK